jgi:hypothetical protein
MTSDDDTLQAVLLHRMPEQDIAAHSERILLEDGFAERLQGVETDLLDDYARGHLTPEDRAAVERYLLVDIIQRERARTARALSHLTPLRRGGRNPLLRWAIPMGALLAAGIAGVYMAPALVSLWAGRLIAPSASTQQVTLLSDSQRSRSIRTVHINQGTSQIRLQLEIPDTSVGKTYVLVIAGLPGAPVQTLDHLKPSQSGPYRFVEVTIPVHMLAAGVHRLTLTPAALTASPQGSYDWLLQTE